MDPLSITVSVVALLSAMNFTLAQAQALHHAPAEVNKLLNEVTDIQIVVNEVQKSLKGRASLSEETETTTNVAAILHSLERKLRELNNVLNRSFYRNTPSGKTKYARITWMKNKRRVDEIQTDMERLKLNLTAVCGAASFLDLSRIRFHLEDISLNYAKVLDSSGRQQNEARSEPADRPGYTPGILKTDSAYSSQCSQLDSSDTAALVRRTLVAAPVARTASPSHTVDVIGSRSACKQWCSCKCHKSTNVQSPDILNKVMGVLSIGYSAVPFIREPCNEKQCERNLSAAFRVRYRYPTWLFARAFVMTFTSILGAPQMSLNTMRVIAPNAEIFRLVRSGDVQGVKKIFAKGEGSIYDIDDQCWTLVHKAFLVGQVDMCEFLIDQGSNIGIEDENGSSIVSRSWFYDRTLSKSSSEEVALHSKILRLTDLEAMVETMQYTVFHKIILGLNKLDLKQQLEHSTATLDDNDSEGYSALWWASARGDSEAVRLLLWYGASLGNKCKALHGPLHVATTPEVVRILLEYGADVDTRDSKGRTPLHCWCYKGEERGGSVDICKAFLDHGADVNARTREGHTPLYYASSYGRDELLPLLLCRGAQMELRKYADGHTALMGAIQCRYATTARFLIENGADYTAKTSRNESILHICARNGDLAIVQVLTAAKLSCLDADAKDAFGMTARECLDERSVKSTEITIAMEALLCSVQDCSVIELDETNDETDT